ncbi:mechanosensitive ion channel family protein [Geofilum rubicundum]|uniref:Potassium efflux system KefA protein n=1 Tax=Geofilum rubicundum JCM 15548 TaxID=1236989 RepID=A0A0E9M222_9BACT|nr:mechanosensitive ion channel domain-containing protein [Geofilum rubicundum]GAO31421.1 potassium efflux system KefA protein [Geofilum rubicundum JCM 15548]
MENQGWLFNLMGAQYLQLAIWAVVFTVAWIFSGFLFKTKSPRQTGRILAGWIIRVALIMFSGWFILWVTGYSIQAFFSKPVLVLFKEIRISPLFVISLLAGVILLLYFNKLLKSIAATLTKKYRTQRKTVNQVRRFLMVFVFLVIAGIWLRFAGSFISDFFSETLFELSNVSVTPWVLLYTMLALYGIAVALRLIEIVYTRHARAKGLDRGQTRTVFQIMKYFIWLVSVLIILQSIGVSIDMLIAGSAALLVGLGFGIQGLFNDFVSGLVLLFEGSVKVDDVVEIESGLIGRVTEVGLRTSKIRTRDNIIMFLPNHKLIEDKLINWSYNESRTRFSVDVGVAYGSDLQLVERLLRECADECADVINKEDTLVLFTNFGDSSLDFKLLFWIEDIFRIEPIRSELRFAIDKKFRENQVTIPFPQRDLHLKSKI